MIHRNPWSLRSGQGKLLCNAHFVSDSSPEQIIPSSYTLYLTHCSSKKNQWIPRDSMAIVHIVKGLLMLLACCRFPEFSRTLFLLHPQAGNREKVLSAWWIEKLHLWNEFHPFLRSGLLSFNSVSTQAKYLSTRSRLLAVRWSSWDARRQLLWRVYSEESTLLWRVYLCCRFRKKEKKSCAKTHDIFHNVSSYKLDFFTPKVSCKFKRQGPPCNSHIDTKRPQINRELNLVAWRMSAMLNLLFVGWQSLIESSLHSFSIRVLFPMITI